jgi:hypothetical protein
MERTCKLDTILKRMHLLGAPKAKYLWDIGKWFTDGGMGSKHLIAKSMPV